VSFVNDPAPPEISTLSLHDALPISEPQVRGAAPAGVAKPLKPALPVHEASPAAGTAGSVPAAAPSAVEFADDFIGVVNRYAQAQDRKSTRLNSSHVAISYAVFCLKK